MEWVKLNTKRYYEYLNSIIEVRGQWSEEVLHSQRGCERHHIIPAAFKGEGDYIASTGRTMFNRESTHSNCIYLYPAEHFEVHRILAEDNPREPLVVRAFWNMFISPGGSRRRGAVTAEEYEQFRALYIEAIKGENNIAKQPEIRQKLCQHHADVSGEHNPMYGSHRCGALNPNYGKGEKVTGGLNGRAVPILCVETGQQFGCLKEAFQWLKAQGSCGYLKAFREAAKAEEMFAGYH